MGNHRADDVETRRDPSDGSTPQAASPSRPAGRRARTTTPDWVEPVPVTPYVGRRAARPAPAEAPTAPAASTATPAAPARPRLTPRSEPAASAPLAPRSPRTAAPVDPTLVFAAPGRRSVVVPDVPMTAPERPERTERPAARVAPPARTAAAAPVVRPSVDDIDTARIDRVLADLAPVDHSTSFSTDVTEVLPLAPQAPATPVTVVGGRRRATTRQAAANPFVRRLPSLPLAVGAVVLGIAVTGTVTTAHTDLVDGSAAIGQIGALGGTSGSGSVRDRAVVSRASDSGLRAGAAALAGDVADRNQRLASVAQQAEARAKDLKANQWTLPVQRGAYRLTARFGEYGLWANYHTGLDFAAPPGTPIYAVAAGTVTSAGMDGPYGNKTVITLADGTELWFCHQTTFLVSPGDKVSPGQQIGTVGSTGHVTGPHLHLEVRPGGGDPVDPFAALVAHGITP